MSDLLYCVTTPTLQSDTSNLVALSDLLLDLGVNDTENPFYKRALAKASQAARSYCSRSFIVRTYTTSISRDMRPGVRQFWNLREYIELNSPVVQVGSITECGAQLVAGTDYSVDMEESRIYRLNAIGDPRPWSRGPIVIMYSAGFAQTPAEAHSVPLSSPYSIRVTDAANFALDLGVSYANGTAFSAVSSPAADGQYSVNPTGTYTFYSGDAGAGVVANYAYNFVPLDVQEAVTRLVKMFKDQRGRDPALKREVTEGQGEKEFWIPNTPMGFLTPDVRELLDQYRVPMVG